MNTGKAAICAHDFPRSTSKRLFASEVTHGLELSQEEIQRRDSRLEVSSLFHTANDRGVELFNSYGAGKEAKQAKWLIHRPVIAEEVLLLPAVEQNEKENKRKTIDVTGRLSTREDLLHMSAAPSKLRSLDVPQVTEFVV